MRELESQYSDGEITKLDGVSVDYPDWHFNVRPSNTEPLLRLNLESLVSREDMEAKRDEVLALIRVVSDSDRTSVDPAVWEQDHRGRHPDPSHPHPVPGRAASTATCWRTSR